MKHFLLLLPFLSPALYGCAGTAEHLRSHPSTYFVAKSNIGAVPTDLHQYVEVHCLREVAIDQNDAVKNSSADDTAGKECLYLSVNAGKLLANNSSVNKNTAAALYAYLINVSDQNCSSFLHRSLATRLGLDFSKGVISDLASGVAAGTAVSNPGISAGLNVANLIVGKGVENFDKTYYFDKTFQAFEAAIEAERARIRSINDLKIAQLQDGRTYYVSTIIDEVRSYDDACSFRSGLAQLVKLADAEKAKQADCKDIADVAATGSEKAAAQLKSRAAGCSPVVEAGVTAATAPASK